MSPAPWEVTREKVLNQAEAGRLLRFVRGRASNGGTSAIVDCVVIEGLLSSGLRCSEFCALRLSDVRLSGPEPAFHVRGKTSEGRCVHIPGDLARTLREYVRSVRPGLLDASIGRDDPAGPLIVSERGRAYERTGLYRRVVSILADAGLEAKASVQLLRHTYGYLAYLRTRGNLLFVQRQLGHAHPQITAVYADLVEESYAELAERAATPTAREKPRAARRESRRKARVAAD